MTLKEIGMFGGGTFAVVGAVALLLLPKNAAEAGPTPSSAAALPPSELSQSGPSEPVELGSPPPEGVELDSEYRRRQFTAFLSARAGETVEIVDAVEISGSQRTEYCGTARSTQGSMRSWSIVLWSHAPIEHTISNEPADCPDGLTLVRDGQAVSWEDARSEQQADLQTYMAPPPAAPSTKGMSAPGSMHDHIDRVSTYAVLIGRGAACGIDTRGPAGRVGAWLDRVAPPGSAAQQTLLPMLMQQSRYHAEQQASGNTPDDCATVARAIRGHPWP